MLFIQILNKCQMNFSMYILFIIDMFKVWNICLKDYSYNNQCLWKAYALKNDYFEKHRINSTDLIMRIIEYLTKSWPMWCALFIIISYSLFFTDKNLSFLIVMSLGWISTARGTDMGLTEDCFSTATEMLRKTDPALCSPKSASFK